LRRPYSRIGAVDSAEGAEKEKYGYVGCGIVDGYGGAGDLYFWEWSVKRRAWQADTWAGRTTRCACCNIDVVISCSVVAYIFQ
jgi:hypothetical protein